MLLNGRPENTGGSGDVFVQRLRQVSQLRSDVSRQAIDANNIGDVDVVLLGQWRIDG